MDRVETPEALETEAVSGTVIFPDTFLGLSSVPLASRPVAPPFKHKFQCVIKPDNNNYRYYNSPWHAEIRFNKTHTD